MHCGMIRSLLTASSNGTVRSGSSCRSTPVQGRLDNCWLGVVGREVYPLKAVASAWGLGRGLDRDGFMLVVRDGWGRTVLSMHGCMCIYLCMYVVKYGLVLLWVVGGVR